MDKSIIEASYPVPKHPTWFFLDNSKMKTFMGCPRKFFYEYILGWRSEGVSIHLEFGKAWHIAQEHLRLNGYSTDSLTDAYSSFLNHYRKYFMEATDSDFAPKNPKGAAEAIVEYAEQYEERDKKITTLYTEVSAITPISDNRDMVVRIDFIGEHKDYGIIGMDYKTAGKYSNMWISSWSTDMQMKIYAHTLRVYFPGQKVFGMIVDGVVLYKNQQKDIPTRHRFVRVPLKISDDIMNDWLFDVNHWYDMIEWNMKQLANSKPEHPTMQAFPKNPGNCTNFNSLCPYHSLCCTWANPLRKCATPPPGLIVRWWDPRTDEDKPPKHNFKEGRRD